MFTLETLPSTHEQWSPFVTTSQDFFTQFIKIKKNNSCTQNRLLSILNAKKGKFQLSLLEPKTKNAKVVKDYKTTMFSFMQTWFIQLIK